MIDKNTSYEEAKSLYPQAVADVEFEIRHSRSKWKLADWNEFQWFVHHGETMEYATLPAQKVYRIYAEKDRLMRSSRLYKMDGQIMEGNWTF